MQDNQYVKTDTQSSKLDDLLANPFGENEMTTIQQDQTTSTTKRLVDVIPEEDRKQAEQLSKQIDPADHQSILQYGTAAQSKLSNFSHAMLDHVQRKDVGPIGDILKELMNRLEQIDPDELSDQKKNVISKLFSRVNRSVNEILSKYQKVGAQVDRISVKLDHSKKSLLDDIHMLDQLYNENKEYFQALNIYIAAAELKREDLESNVIPALREKAEKSSDQMAYQEVNDMMQFLDRLDKRIHDLQLSRQITIQSAPQIRMIQNINQALAEKIQASILTAIPLWKNQIAIALTLFRQQRAVEAQKQVTKTTNELLLKNSEMLKTNSIETAKENERGIVDIETLKTTQSNLVSTLEETLRIQEEGRQKRRQAEGEIQAMEAELKQQLLQLKNKRG
ncbi:toxic anion resistance family protein [Jeotgalibacillus alimentarius]|uniref:Toxic anion resistance family protein n=1 Tax=Jeotgalibacillus alimentarius TaxID=135826 RepID=A0A0C2RF30_9BACL|nr:toxic anion resistance protein [Jeotgalibacillus alimentarius]KIL48810.1 toxic anion resistance family protein [Jeotgalibacillus alimentarius]